MVKGSLASHLRASARSTIRELGESGIVFRPAGIAGDKRTIDAIIDRAPAVDGEQRGRSLVWRVSFEVHATRGLLKVHKDDQIQAPFVADGTDLIILEYARTLRDEGDGLITCEYRGTKD